MTTASIIISSYNYAPYLRQAIESALAQSHPRTEVIVVDDGSTDDSPNIIREYGSRVRAVLKQNAGQASSMNAGLVVASGDAVIFLDSDDALQPHAVERALGLMSNTTSKVHWPLRKVDASGTVLPHLEPAAELPRGQLCHAVLQHGPRSDEYLWPPTSGNAWSRRFLEQVMPIPEASYRTCPDLYLCALAPLYGAVEATVEPLGYWRVHGDNNTWKEPFLSRLARYTELWEACCTDLERHARRLGHSPDPARWKRESWWHRLHAAADELSRLLRPAEPVILIDEGQWGCSELDGRPVLPLLDDAGAPADDDAALRALESRLQSGAGYLVVSWSSHWWLEHYSGLSRDLRKRFTCVVESDDLVVFDLRSGGRTHG